MDRKKPSFHRPRRLELDYQKRIDQLVPSWIQRPPADMDLDELVRLLGGFASGEAFLEEHVQRLATGMVTMVAQGNSRSWRAAAAKASQGRRIYELLRDEMNGAAAALYRGFIQQNADLVRSLPRELAGEAVRYIAEREMKGERADVIAADLRSKLPRMAAYKVDRLARTSVASAATSITRFRADRLGLNVYQWDTSEDARVRPSHRIMDLVLVRWDRPPAPEALLGIKSTLGHYHAGNCPHCRCDPNVVVDADQVHWPCKAYIGGQIKRINRREFLAWAA